MSNRWNAMAGMKTANILKMKRESSAIEVNDFALRMRDNLVPIRKSVTGTVYYDSEKNAVYIPEKKHFGQYNDYVQELMRQVVTATGHQQRMARQGMVMKGGMAPSEDATKYEQLVAELASGVKMMELGLPSKLSNDSLSLRRILDTGAERESLPDRCHRS